MFRFRRGEALLAHVVSKFDAIIADLDQAVTDIQEKQKENDIKMNNARTAFMTLEENTRKQNMALQVAATRANTVRSNISVLIGQ